MEAVRQPVRRALEFGIYRDGDNNLNESQEAAVHQAVGVSAANPAIHTGTCARLGGVYKALSSVIGGHSETNVIGMTIGDLMRGTYAINVHKGEGLLVSTYVACADISKVAAQM